MKSKSKKKYFYINFLNKKYRFFALKSQRKEVTIFEDPIYAIEKYGDIYISKPDKRLAKPVKWYDYKNISVDETIKIFKEGDGLKSFWQIRKN